MRDAQVQKQQAAIIHVYIYIYTLYIYIHNPIAMVQIPSWVMICFLAAKKIRILPTWPSKPILEVDLKHLGEILTSSWAQLVGVLSRLVGKKNVVYLTHAHFTMSLLLENICSLFVQKVASKIKKRTPNSNSATQVFQPLNNIDTVGLLWQKKGVRLKWIPSRESTYPTLGKGKSSTQKWFDFWWDMLVPWRVNSKQEIPSSKLT